MQVNWALLRLELKGKEINEAINDKKRQEVEIYEHLSKTIGMMDVAAGYFRL